MLWTEKYNPKNFDEVLGNAKAKDEIEDWINAWILGEHPKPLLLVGPPGTGKTTLAHLAAQEFADSIELNASDKRSYDILLRTNRRSIGHWFSLQSGFEAHNTG